MAKLYGLGNYLISELTTKLISDDEFNKFVFYKDIDSQDILNMPDLDNPFVQLKGQVFQNRRPSKVLENQDVCVFLYLDDIRNKNAKSKKVKTVIIRIGFVVHEQCSKTVHGLREVALISAIEKVVEGSKFQKALGDVSVVRVNKLAGLPHEWNGYEVIVECDGFTESCTLY
ncbi:MAG: hypothetical protein ACRC18_07200 [Cetobacterium sp.]